MSEESEALWNAITSRNTRQLVEQMRSEKPSLARDWQEEQQRSRRFRSWDENAADEAGSRTQGPL
jgi:hypothetical protein